MFCHVSPGLFPYKGLCALFWAWSAPESRSASWWYDHVRPECTEHISYNILLVVAFKGYIVPGEWSIINTLRVHILVVSLDVKEQDAFDLYITNKNIEIVSSAAAVYCGISCLRSIAIWLVDVSSLVGYMWVFWAPTSVTGSWQRSLWFEWLH